MIFRAAWLGLILAGSGLVLGAGKPKSHAADPFTGVWKLDKVNSQLPFPVPREQTATVDADAARIRISEEVVSAEGQRSTISVDAKFDGKDYPITGSPFADTAAYRRADRWTIHGTAKKAGQVVVTETVVIARDGRTMTATYSSTDAAGKTTTALAVFKRQ